MTSTELLLSEPRPDWRDDARAGVVVCVSIIIMAVIADCKEKLNSKRVGLLLNIYYGDILQTGKHPG
jgi:hypothetical protein